VTSGSPPLSGIRVGVDLDGVCCDYVAYLRRFLLTAGRTSASLPDPVDYDLSEWFDTREARIAAHTAAVAAGLHRDAPTLPGAAEGIRVLRDLGASVILASARGSHGEDPMAVRRDINAWARTYGVNYDDVHLGRPKSAAACHAYVDDAPADVLALRAEGHLTVVFDQPWNQHIPGPRANGWPDLPAILVDLLAPARRTVR